MEVNRHTIPHTGPIWVQGPAALAGAWLRAKHLEVGAAQWANWQRKDSGTFVCNADWLLQAQIKQGNVK